MDVSRDWIDYLGAFAGAVGAVAALIAIGLAVRSAREARRSADAAEASREAGERTAAAAEATAQHARDELELLKAEYGRRPKFEMPTARFLPGPAPHLPVLELVIVNVGSKDAMPAILNIWVPQRHSSILARTRPVRRMANRTAPGFPSSASPRCSG